MNIHIVGATEPIKMGMESFQDQLGFKISEDGLPLTVEHSEGKKILVSYENGAGKIVYNEPVQFFRALGIFLQYVQDGETSFSVEEEVQFNTVGPMFDLSRNAVLNIESFKGIIRKLALMGFNASMLYMEDTYEVKGEPYFGYMRGRYSQEELKELDDYAHMYGIELIPCIQTLAHLEEFLKWSAAAQYKDTRGALLLESEQTYTLLENMIGAVTSPFRSKKIHIGMDEAEEVGRGIYLNKHGHKPRFELMAEHLRRVLDIVESKGLEAMMWSDMFLKLASTTGDHYHADTVIPDYIIDQTPKNVQLMYWQYNATEKSHYTKILKKHKSFGRPPAFAGGIWVWNTFATNYSLSLKTSEAALTACKEEGVQDVFVTLWGDDGYENNVYSALLGLQLYAEHAYSKEVDNEKLRKRVKFCTGIEEETFLLLNELDRPPGVEKDNKDQSNPSKFLLWQDVLLGLFDKHVEGLDLKTHYEALEKDFKEKRNSSASLDYIFEVPEKLASVLALKGSIGVHLKEAYDKADTDSLSRMAKQDLPEIINRVQALRSAHRTQWFKMNKPFGWEVIDIRYGGLLSRLDTAIERINQFLENEISVIEELEQERLYFTQSAESSTGLGWCSYYYRMASPNVFFHVLPIY